MKYFGTLLLAISLFAMPDISKAQNVGINANGAAPDVSAMLEVKSTTRGFLVPRMKAAQRIAIPSPATGLILYQNKVTKGW